MNVQSKLKKYDNPHLSNGCKLFISILLILSAIGSAAQTMVPLLKISPNKRYFVTGNNKPFFWLGDTGWLLFIKCTREDAIKYLDARKQQGFNVIQAMLLHDFRNTKNVYGDWALNDFDISKPLVTPGNKFADANEYDYWDNVDFIIDEAAKRGIYMALVPVWGSNVKAGKVNVQQADVYGKFLAQRYKSKNNIIWLNGGDINGKDSTAVWNKLGTTIKQYDKKHLMTFHPRGRTSSSDWFHNAPWLDFNMVQSGHKSYEQDTAINETRHFGEDNWKYIAIDYKLKPARPTIDGEPSYEEIPYGLHDSTQPYWQSHEIRRYAYWSVLAGGAGFTYGHNSIMQFYTPGDTGVSFFPKQSWKEALTVPTAVHMKYLKQVMLEKPFYDRMPAQELIVDNGDKYDKVLAFQGKNYAMFYVYNGRSFSVAMNKLHFKAERFVWYNTFYGTEGRAAKIKNAKKIMFDPPGEKAAGNDWLLILETGKVNDEEREKEREREKEKGAGKD